MQISLWAPAPTLTADTAQAMVWLDAGSPDPGKRVYDVAGVCAWCGTHSNRGCRLRDVLGTSFTGWDDLSVPRSDMICVPCTWCMTGTPPMSLRMWSIVVRSDRPVAHSHPASACLGLGERTHAQNKADPSEFDAILRNPPSTPWVCVVADSGKIHTTPYAQVNTGRYWTVRFERVDVRGDSDRYTVIADAQQRLYDLGFSKTEIQTGEPESRRIGELIDDWMREDLILAPHRGSQLFELALFLRRKQ